MTAPPTWRRRAQPLLGTVVDISLPASTPDAAFNQATDAAFARVAQVQACMSFHDATSDLRALARAPADAVLRVAPDTWVVLRQSLDMEACSGGVFNVCVAPQLVAMGLLPMPCDALPPQARCLHEALTLLPNDQVQVLATPWIDLGGIAKGHAVDCAVQALKDLGLKAGLVNAGGDMRAFGEGSHTVHLRFASGLWPVAQLHNSALATSCNAHSQRSPHIDTHIDTLGDTLVNSSKDRRSSTGQRCTRSVVVHAPTATLADAFSKIALLRPALAHRLCQASFGSPFGMSSESSIQWRTFDYFDTAAGHAPASEAIYQAA